MDEAGGCHFAGARLAHNNVVRMTSSRSLSQPQWAPRSADGAVHPCGSMLPPAPPGCRYVTVRWLGVVIADDDLRRRVDRVFHGPMIVLALLVLPLLLLDYFFVREGTGEPVSRGWMWWLVLSGMTLIWIAFTLEFVVKIAIAENRIEYLRRNWLDLIIIVIPILRPLRVAALARTSKVFTLRGVGFKFARYVFTLVIGLEATNRIMRRMGFQPKVMRPDPLKMTRLELCDELVRLRELTDAWDAWYARQQAYLERNGHPRMPMDCPGQTETRAGTAIAGDSVEATE